MNVTNIAVSCKTDKFLRKAQNLITLYCLTEGTRIIVDSTTDRVFR